MPYADRAELAARNRAVAAFRHRTTLREHLRRYLLRALAKFSRPTRPAFIRPDSILLIRPDHLGDVLFTTPAIRTLAQARPDAEIYALVGPWSASVLAPFAHDGELARVLTLPFPGFERGRRYKHNMLSAYTLAWRSAQWLRQMGMATAVIMRPDHWWGAMVAHLAGIPIRLGYDLPDVSPFLTERLAFDLNIHSARLNLDLTARWTGTISNDDASLEFPISEEDRVYIDRYLADHGCCDPGERLIMIHPGAGSPYKTWLAARWATVADALSERTGARVVLTGTGHEAREIRQIVRAMNAKKKPIVAVDATTVGQLAALCARADLVLGPDSGPLHLAVSVGTSTIHLYGPADPVVYGPWGDEDKHKVLQSTLACIPCKVLDWSGDDPAYHRCIHEISIAQVLAAANTML